MWNCAHNVGGGIPPLLFLLGMAWFNDWHAALYMPAFAAILLAIFAFAMMRDTPQSCGLPPIEEYKNDYPDDYSEEHEQELTAKQIFMQYILPVSYTHLDVYKRQAEDGVAQGRLLLAVLCPGALNDIANFHIRRAGHLTALAVDAVPVSYTHLDVYKRQGRKCVKWLATA